MSDSYRVRCACGAVRDAEDYTYGLVVTCYTCGKSIEVVEANFASGDSATKTGAPVEHPTAPPEMSPEAARAQAAFGLDEDEEEASPEPAGAEAHPLREQPQISAVEVCARCGTAFRGDWDRVEADEGTICYLCSNQATEALPERITRAASPSESLPPPVVETGEAPETFLGFDTTSLGFRAVLSGLAIATVVAAYWVTYTGWGSAPVGTASLDKPKVDAEDVPGWLRAVYWGAYLSEDLIVIGLTVFLLLWRRNALPGDGFRENLLFIGLPVGGAALVGVLGAFVALGLPGDTEIPYRGFVYLFAFLVQGAIVFTSFDWRFTDFLWAIFFYVVSSNIVGMVNMLVLAWLTTLVL